MKFSERIRAVSEKVSKRMLAAVNTGWSAVVSVSRYEVPSYARWGLWIQAVFVVICLALFQIFPLVPGVAIGFLAAVAVVITFRALKDLFPAEQVVWTLIVFALLVVELRVTYAERDQFNREKAQSALAEADRRRQENQRFQDIANTLTKSIDIGQTQFRETQSQLSLSANEVTGGDSFADVTLNQTQNGFHLTNKGDYPLNSLHILVIDLANRAAATNLQMTTLAPHFGIGLGYPYNFLDGLPHDFGIVFNAVNGSWMETFQTRMVGGKISVALKVERFVIKRHKGGERKVRQLQLPVIEENVDASYPLTAGKVDWNRFWTPPGGTIVEPH
jgi:hypothetical protein